MVSLKSVSLTQLLYLITYVLYSVSGNKATHKRNCFQNFNHRIQKCLDPFSKLFKTYQQTQDESSFSSIVKKHICFEYEKMLLCMHSTLTHCPTLRNIKKVQEKLGANWVNNVNELCRIPPTKSTPRKERVNTQSNSVEINHRTQTMPTVKNLIKANEIPPMWDVIAAKNRILQKQEAEMWQKLKKNWRQRAAMLKQLKSAATTETAVKEKSNIYTVYNIFYNTNNPWNTGLILGTKMAAQTSIHSSSQASSDTSVLALTISILISAVIRQL